MKIQWNNNCSLKEVVHCPCPFTICYNVMFCQTMYPSAVATFQQTMRRPCESRSLPCRYGKGTALIVINVMRYCNEVFLIDITAIYPSAYQCKLLNLFLFTTSRSSWSVWTEVMTHPSTSLRYSLELDFGISNVEIDYSWRQPGSAVKC